MPFFAPKVLIYAVILAGMFASGLWIGYSHEHRLFEEFKAQVTAAGEAAKVRAKEIEERHEKQTAAVEQDYKDRIAGIQRRYANSLRDSSRSKLPATADATARLDEAAAHSEPYLVEKCAETTAQLIELQNWIKRTQE